MFDVRPAAGRLPPSLLRRFFAPRAECINRRPRVEQGTVPRTEALHLHQMPSRAQKIRRTQVGLRIACLAFVLLAGIWLLSGFGTITMWYSAGTRYMLDTDGGHVRFQQNSTYPGFALGFHVDWNAATGWTLVELPPRSFPLLPCMVAAGVGWWALRRRFARLSDTGRCHQCGYALPVARGDGQPCSECGAVG